MTDVIVRECTTDNCFAVPAAKGMCRRHYKAAWHATNRDRVTASMRARYAANPDEYKIRARLRAAADPAAERARLDALSERLAADPDYRARVNAKRRTVEVRAKRVQEAHVRRARLRGVPSERIDRHVVWERDEGVCGICHRPADPADWWIDHIIPLVAGGPHLYGNVQVSHPVCNRRKGAKLP